MAGAVAPLGTARAGALAARLGGPVAGVDEVGRGPWAGPVLAAAVVLDPAAVPDGLADSKTLPAARRETLAEALAGSARIAIGRAGVAEIDRLNILRAGDLAMARALAALAESGALAGALVDGNRVPGGLPCPAEALVGGDGLEAAIAAASIVAKVARDRIMAGLAERHPGYGWERNMGYGTAEHRAALARLGVSPQHRRSFRPIHNILCEEPPTTS
jgi:ribonuclease HII